MWLYCRLVETYLPPLSSALCLFWNTALSAKKQLKSQSTGIPWTFQAQSLQRALAWATPWPMGFFPLVPGSFPPSLSSQLSQPFQERPTLVALTLFHPIWYGVGLKCNPHPTQLMFGSVCYTHQDVHFLVCAVAKCALRIGSDWSRVTGPETWEGGFWSLAPPSSLPGCLLAARGWASFLHHIPLPFTSASEPADHGPLLLHTVRVWYSDQWTLTKTLSVSVTIALLDLFSLC